MVSLRRRRLMGLCSGKSSIPVELTSSTENSGAVNLNRNVNSFSIHPLPSTSSNHEKQTNIHETSFGSSTVSATSSPKEEADNYFPGKDIRHRKRYRRKLYEDQEPCILRGVYFKNMKWQAAIKVEKKQIHLGTVGSQEDAARLYDRAAFMCGRQPNFELPEEEKRELSHYNWEEFLAVTRNAINHKKLERRIGGGRRKKAGIQMRGSDVEEPERGACGSQSVSDDGEVEVFAS